MIYKKIFYVFFPIFCLIGVIIGGGAYIQKTLAGKSPLAPMEPENGAVIPFTPKTDNLSKELDRLQEYEIIQDSEAAKKYAASNDCGKLPNGSTRSCNSNISDPGERYYFSKSQGADEIVHALVGDFTYKPKVKFKVFSNDTAEKLMHELPQILERPVGEVYKIRAQFMLADHVKNTINRVSDEYNFHDFDLDDEHMLHQGIRYKLEGYIGTGDYEISKSIPNTALMRMMVGKFVEMVKPYKSKYDKIIGHKILYPWGAGQKTTFHDLVCLASDLVGEAQLHPEQQPGIASVYWNRVAEDHSEISGLNLDATFVYGYVNSNDYDPANKDNIEYQRKHNNWYNTYQMRIINKGAIAQVSKSAWDAIINPEDTKNIFYLHDKSGNIHYAETYDAHKENEVKYGLSDGTHD